MCVSRGVRQRKLDERVTYSTDRCKLDKWGSIRVAVPTDCSPWKTPARRATEKNANYQARPEKHLPLLTEGGGASLGYRGHKDEQAF
jgi:hypothetical protein